MSNNADSNAIDWVFMIQISTHKYNSESSVTLYSKLVNNQKCLRVLSKVYHVLQHYLLCYID